MTVLTSRWVLSLFLLNMIAGLAAEAQLSDNLTQLLCFGPPSSCPDGWVAVEPNGKDPRFLWRGMELGARDRGSAAGTHRALVYGTEGEFLMGLESGSYQLELTLGDFSFPHGPFDVLVQGQPIAIDVVTRPSEFKSYRLSARVTNGFLSIRFVAHSSANFAVTSLVIKGPPQHGEHFAFREFAPVKEIPPAQALQEHGAPDITGALKRQCDWLMQQQLPDGFFKQPSREWYRVAYAVRALIACEQVLNVKGGGDESRTAYLAAATKTLDLFLGEQLPNGSWTNVYRGKPTVTAPPAELDAAMKGTTNLADIGTISVALAAASPLVDTERRERYLSALTRYVEEYAAPWQLSSGAFPNGRWSGRDMHFPYSVATGTQAMSFLSLYAIAGHEKDLRAGERAVEFLLSNWNSDGRPVHHSHADDSAKPVKSTAFGDVEYYNEGILWAWYHTPSKSLRNKIVKRYDEFINGSAGLLQAQVGGVWWPPTGEDWIDCKAPGTFQALVAFARQMKPDNTQVAQSVDLGIAFLADPEFSKRAGIMLDPEAPWGKFSVTATGMAALALAEAVQPGVTYLAASKRESARE